MLDTALPYFTFKVSSGDLNLLETSVTTWVGSAYSGFKQGRNNTTFEAMKGFGPIPRGWYTLVGPFDNYVSEPDKHYLGDCVFRLTPDEGNAMFNRSGFLLHGNNKTNDASRGCIVAGPSIRQHINQIFHRGVTRLKVI